MNIRPNAPSWRPLALKGGLLALLASCLAIALAHSGVVSPAASVLIVLSKCMLIAAFYLALRRASIMTRIATLTGVLCVGVLLVLTSIDYANRHSQPPAWQHPLSPTLAQPALGPTV